MTLNLLQHERPRVAAPQINLADWKDDFLAPHPRLDWATEIALKNR
jgi:hypothetical protein